MTRAWYRINWVEVVRLVDALEQIGVSEYSIARTGVDPQYSDIPEYRLEAKLL